MADLFQKKQWVGEFFTNGEYQSRFVGELSYCPEAGVKLSYSITGHQVPNQSNIVHGVLSTGEACTLVGNFFPQNSGVKLSKGLSSRFGTVGFLCLVIGAHLEDEESIYKVNFSLTGLQEFFFPKGYKDLVKYSSEPLLSIDTKYGKLSVGNNAQFGSLSRDVTTQIYSRDEQAQKALQETFSELEESYPEANFMLKKDISYRIYLQNENGGDIKSFYEYINEIANLFSLLIYSPVFPDSIKLVKEVGGFSEQLSVYPTMLLDKRTMELSLQERTHFHMPITRSKIDLELVLSNWLGSEDNYSTLISRIQNESGFRSEHELHGEIVLYGTQLEFISYDEDMKLKKYEYPIDTYASVKIKKTIEKVFNTVNITDIGVGISSLRNEIAHVGRPKKILKVISMNQLMELSLCLQLTIIGWVLFKLGVSKDVIDVYQDKRLPDKS
ncbi:hypothetical protein CBX98_24550 [Vibrio sp. T9]|uniref:ApeA N-terminal domain 1-containing protein n=1 Tax=Vibrio sp. T9 TaxID=2007196 RepID=UPI000D643F17|nr:HEPN domain-containing protein [Vibrio sp. T9]PWF67230.1 hypothetical protein CBX98_24550 [Vibrio sp. T9]